MDDHLVAQTHMSGSTGSIRAAPAAETDDHPHLLLRHRRIKPLPPTPTTTQQQHLPILPIAAAASAYKNEEHERKESHNEDIQFVLASMGLSNSSVASAHADPPPPPPQHLSCLDDLPTANEEKISGTAEPCRSKRRILPMPRAAVFLFTTAAVVAAVAAACGFSFIFLGREAAGGDPVFVGSSGMGMCSSSCSKPSRPQPAIADADVILNTTGMMAFFWPAVAKTASPSAASNASRTDSSNRFSAVKRLFFWPGGKAKAHAEDLLHVTYVADAYLQEVDRRRRCFQFPFCSSSRCSSSGGGRIPLLLPSTPPSSSSKQQHRLRVITSLAGTGSGPWKNPVAAFLMSKHAAGKSPEDWPVHQLEQSLLEACSSIKAERQLLVQRYAPVLEDADDALVPSRLCSSFGESSSSSGSSRRTISSLERLANLLEDSWMGNLPLSEYSSVLMSSPGGSSKDKNRGVLVVEEASTSTEAASSTNTMVERNPEMLDGWDACIIIGHLHPAKGMDFSSSWACVACPANVCSTRAAAGSTCTRSCTCCTRRKEKNKGDDAFL